MNSGAVAGIAPYVNLSSAHSIPGCVSDVSVNNDCSRVHSISDRVLSVAVYRYIRAVEISAESVSGSSSDFDTLVAHSGSDEPLADASRKDALLSRGANLFVKFGISEL